MRVIAILATCLLVACGSKAAPRAPESAGEPGSVMSGFDAGRLARIDGLVEESIAARQLPGAVVLVGHGDRTVYAKAYGHRALVPALEPMTFDTIFDIASLTKVVATTTSVMVLIEQGRIRLNDRVAAHIPGFERYGKQDVTVRHLLTHVSGLRPDFDLNVPFDGYARAIELATEEVLEAPPGQRFVYSDINFFLLGDIVARVSGAPLDVFARKHVFEPLGMKDTMFRPPDTLDARIAPTEPCERLAWPCQTPGAPMLRGLVHDPTARRMGGVAGHAGLFSTAADLARFARALLRGGELDGVRVLAPLAVARMIEPASPEDLRQQRALGWDVDSSFSANRGELLPVGSFGHTGFTGTSLWIDPATQVFVVFLSNRVHPDGKGDVTPLRARVATAAAAAFIGAPPLASLQQH
ncbi:MAG: serine hydrolase domain-containing protein, partial [Vicinamibacterales bacterium]